jgi:hypothetical protein
VVALLHGTIGGQPLVAVAAREPVLSGVTRGLWVALRELSGAGKAGAATRTERERFWSKHDYWVGVGALLGTVGRQHADDVPLIAARPLMLSGVGEKPSIALQKLGRAGRGRTAGDF